jgi:thioredoxin-like negative regulator of GroEL
LSKLLTNGAEAYSAERYEEARKALRIVADEAPSAASVRELYGLTLYRLGRWAAAADELEAFRSMTGSTEQNPVLADCYRALRRYTDVDEVWRELREASPSADLVTEGRIVAAGALADRGELAEALELLGRRFEPPARAQDHHVRRA